MWKNSEVMWKMKEGLQRDSGGNITWYVGIESRCVSRMFSSVQRRGEGNEKLLKIETTGHVCALETNLKRNRAK